MKKIAAIALSACVGLSMLAVSACNSNQGAYVTMAIAREAGSGTRGAFDELVANSNGDLLGDAGDRLSTNVLISTSTGAVITAVAQNSYTLGYVSLGSVEANKDKIKTVSVEGVEATTENIVNGTYRLSRPFILVYPSYDGLTNLAKNFLSFIGSADGQAIVGNGYIPCGEGGAYTAYIGSETTLKLGGSTSVGPLMEELVAAYKKLNTGVNVTVEGGGSGTGIAQAGTSFDIGMSSRELKSTETGLESYKIADDGIAVIVKVNCALTNVTLDQIYDLYVNGTKIECR